MGGVAFAPFSRRIALPTLTPFGGGSKKGEVHMLRSIALVGAVLLAGPAAAREEPNMLTSGMVSMTLRVGETSQAQIIETFGAPNIMTIDGNGQEMWVYDRQATVSSSSNSGFSIGMLLGAAGNGIAGGSGLGFGKSKSRTSSSSRTMTLIIKFDARKIVSDFKSRSSSF